MPGKLRVFLLITALELAVLCGLVVGSQILLRHRAAAEIPRKGQLVKELELTDLAIWTEARYTRHPSQADFFAPFQDCPSSLEHFPAGSVVAAPDRRSSRTGVGP